MSSEPITGTKSNQRATEPLTETDHIPQAFLDSIDADPKSDEPVLLLADWLEERGDARAEALRTDRRPIFKGGFIWRNEGLLRGPKGPETECSLLPRPVFKWLETTRVYDTTTRYNRKSAALLDFAQAWVKVNILAS